MEEINFAGPAALLPNTDDIPLLLADPDAWRPGIYLWAYLFNKAYRTNFVGVASTSVAERHSEHLSEFLTGMHTVYAPAALRQGKLSPAFQAGGDRALFVAEFPSLMEQLTQLRVFYAAVDAPPPLLERVALGIIAHLQRLGGRAAEWLDNEPIGDAQRSDAEPLTVRLHRPAFIASLPDEMHL